MVRLHRVHCIYVTVVVLLKIRVNFFLSFAVKLERRKKKTNIVQTCLDLMRLLRNRMIPSGFARKKKKKSSYGEKKKNQT